MIVSFSVANFRSIAGEQTLSLVASRRDADSHPGHLTAVPQSEEKVLRAAVLYGANGAGKSNLFKAMKYLRTMVLEPRARNTGTGREAFQFGDSEQVPSDFDLQFIVAGKLYRYGLVVDDHRVLEEWLARVEGKTDEIIYERSLNAEEFGMVSWGSGFKAPSDGRLTALATVGGPQNQSFLATIRVTLEKSHYGEELKRIFNWFIIELHMVEPDEKMFPLGGSFTIQPKLQKFVGDFLKSSSTGIDHLIVRKTDATMEQIHDLLGPEALAEFKEERVGESLAITMMQNGVELLHDKSTPSGFQFLDVQAAHKHQPGKVVALNLHNESDGTRRLLELTPALFHLQKGGAVYFIDEIDRSMHPMLVWKYLEFFLNSCAGSTSQIIVTTHESNLLDLELLRRDEIWFAEKDPAGASQFYSLSDFKPREDFQLRKQYLQGRFGGIPFLGGIDRLMEQPQKVQKPPA